MRQIVFTPNIFHDVIIYADVSICSDEVIKITMKCDIRYLADHYSYESDLALVDKVIYNCTRKMGRLSYFTVLKLQISLPLSRNKGPYLRRPSVEGIFSLTFIPRGDRAWCTYFTHMNQEYIARNSSYFTVLGVLVTLPLNSNKGPN